ncbi:hypothetical protein D9757_003868 [Collybiopsis confluens]|uniref:FAD dependent oxidoreductase domain-containing protein n=1 Tax=Collybiopsis confluens TaxID=2823264 RepID=A0A8H5HVS2_9AGAR|nr:hypothetical protein D9757_003868 [Collybiopsis confluens]
MKFDPYRYTFSKKLNSSTSASSYKVSRDLKLLTSSPPLEIRISCISQALKRSFIIIIYNGGGYHYISSFFPTTYDSFLIFSLMSSTAKKEVVVLGAGVIGLTTAIMIQEEKGSEYHVTIVAETFPTDPRTFKYTSFWAGASCICTGTDDVNLQRMERETFDTVWKMSEPGSGVAEGCLLRCRNFEYLTERTRITENDEHPCSFMPDFRQLQEGELVPGAVQGFTFTTVTFDIPRYLPYLLSRFLAAGGAIVRGAVGHIQPLLEGGAGLFPDSSSRLSPPDAVILCVGIGARFLGGIEDKDMYPVRGQTVLLNAPWVKEMPILVDIEGDIFPYIIPRKGGHVIVGGTFHRDDWYPRPRPEITEHILAKALKLWPELAPQNYVLSESVLDLIGTAG